MGNENCCRLVLTRLNRRRFGLVELYRATVTRFRSLLLAACEKRSILMFDPLCRRLIHAIDNAHNDCVNCVRWDSTSIHRSERYLGWYSQFCRLRIQSINFRYYLFEKYALMMQFLKFRSFLSENMHSFSNFSILDPFYPKLQISDAIFPTLDPFYLKIWLFFLFTWL